MIVFIRNNKDALKAYVDANSLLHQLSKGNSSKQTFFNRYFNRYNVDNKHVVTVSGMTRCVNASKILKINIIPLIYFIIPSLISVDLENKKSTKNRFSIPKLFGLIVLGTPLALVGLALILPVSILLNLVIHSTRKIKGKTVNNPYEEVEIKKFVTMTFGRQIVRNIDPLDYLLFKYYYADSEEHNNGQDHLSDQSGPTTKNKKIRSSGMHKGNPMVNKTKIKN